jgi:transposase InsO family protein
MSKLDVHRMPKLEHVNQLYDVCITTKQRRAPFPKKAKYCTQRPLELVHSDVYGPISPVTPGGRRYFLLLMDDHTRYMWVVLISGKGDAAALVRQVQAAAKAESSRKLRVIHTDNGGEFTFDEFERHCSDHWILHQLTVPYARSRTVSRSSATRRWWAWRALY